jgi:hypothetical protein
VAATVEVSPSLVTLNSIGSVQQLSAVVKSADGSMLTGVPLTWRSANDAVATVSSSGTVTAVANGSVTISAMSGAAIGTAEVTVTAPPSALQWTIDRQSLGSTTLRKVWQAPTGEIFAVGGNLIARGSGNAWSQIAPSITPASYTDVWGASAHDVLVVSEYGQILRWDGTAWAVKWSDPTVSFYGVWGTAADNVFAVGSAGSVVHWDGSRWQRMDTGLNESLVAVWASSANNVIAVSRFGTAMHWDGSAWRSVNTGVGGLSSVWGFSPSDVYAVGGYDAVHWDGQAWSRVDVGVRWAMNRVVGTPEGELFVAAEFGILRRRNGLWEELRLAGLWGQLYGAWASSNAGLVTVGDLGSAYRWDSSGWSLLLNPMVNDDVFSIGADATYILTRGTLWQWNGSRMALVNTDGRVITSVWGTNANSLWVVAQPGRVLRWDGSQWHDMNLASADFPVRVFGTSATDVLVLTPTRSHHWNGATWQQHLMPPGSMSGNPRVWGTASDSVYFAVGARGAIIKFSANQWQVSSSGTTVNLHGVWGTDSRNVYAVGDDGVILHWNGINWQRDSSGVSNHLYDVWGTAKNDVYAVGQNGAILRNDGAGWKNLPSGTTQHLYRIHGASARTAYAVGLGGVVLRGSRQ